MNSGITKVKYIVSNKKYLNLYNSGINESISPARLLAVISL